MAEQPRCQCGCGDDYPAEKHSDYCDIYKCFVGSDDDTVEFVPLVNGETIPVFKQLEVDEKALREKVLVSNGEKWVSVKDSRTAAEMEERKRRKKEEMLELLDALEADLRAMGVDLD